MKPVFELAKKQRKDTSCTIALAQRIKKNWGEMLKQNKTKKLWELMENVDNVLEHFFNVQMHCNDDLCYAKKA